MTTGIVRGVPTVLLSDWVAYEGGPLANLDANPSITIVNAVTAAVALATTTVGVIHSSTGIYVYAYTPADALPDGTYLVTWSGLAASVPVVATETLTLTGVTTIATLDRFKKQLRRTDPTDTDDDVELTYWLTEATEVVEELIDGPIVPTTFVEASTTGRSGVITLDRRPLISVTSITPDYPSAAPINTALYSVDTDDGVINWRGTYGFRVIVVYRAGLTTIPARYVRAGLIIAQHLYLVENGGGAAPTPGESTLVPGAGYAIPNRAVELLAPTIFGGFA